MGHAKTPCTNQRGVLPARVTKHAFAVEPEPSRGLAFHIIVIAQPRAGHVAPPFRGDPLWPFKAHDAVGDFAPDELRGWSFGDRVRARGPLRGDQKALMGRLIAGLFYGRGGMQGCGPDFGPLWDVARVRSGSCDRFSPKPCREPVDHLGKGGACFALTVKARLVQVQFFDHRGRERDQVKAKAGVDFFEFIIKEFEQVVRVAAGFALWPR